MRCFYGASRPPGDLGEIYDLRDAMKEAMISSRRPAAMRQDRRWRRLDWKAAVALYNPPKAAELARIMHCGLAGGVNS